jgi:CHAT domain-containing protein
MIRRFCLILLLVFSTSFAQDTNPTESLINSLLAAKSQEERNQLLIEHKEQVTIELRKSLIARGNVLRERSDFPGALTAFELARSVAEQIQDKSGISEALINVALINRTLGDIDLALKNVQQSLAVAEQSNDQFLIARSLVWMGIFFRYQGHSDQAVLYTNKALNMADHLPEKELAFAWNNLGAIHWMQGNFSEALKYYGKALELREKLGDKNAIAMSLNNIAIAYDSQGSFAEALKYYNRSLKIFEELGDKAAIANTLNNMTDLRLLGNYDVYLENCKRNLALAEEAGDKTVIARALGNLANAYGEKGDYDTALEFSFKGIAISEELKDRIYIAVEQHHVSEAYFGKSEYAKSLEYAKVSEKNAREIGARQQLWRALEIQGRCYRKLNQPDLAYNAYNEAIRTIEDWRSLVAGGELEEQSLFSEKLQAYYGMIELQLEQNKVDEAFSYAERARGRTLLDVLHSGRIDIAKEMTSQEREEESRWNSKLITLNRNIQDEKNNSNVDQKKIVDLESELETARLDYEAFRSKLYTLHPGLKVRRGEADPIKTDEIEQLFSGDRIAVFEYVVTESNTFLFVLTKEGEILNTKVHKIGISEEKLNEKIQSFRKQIADRDPGFGVGAKTLYGLLVEPGVGDLVDEKKLILIPDNVLWELPFQALQSGNNRYLQENYSLSYASSLTVLREMKRLQKNNQDSENKILLAFGNPSLGTKKGEYSNVVYRDAGLQPLPEAEREVKTLQKIYGLQHSKIYVDAQAREDYFKSEASQFEILHLATHGILNNASPMYSYLALAPGDSESEDGLLEAREIMSLNLNADLVVLSACDTALGKIGKGEGIIGLSWAFFVAGTPATLVSQWKVHSESTGELMLAFHRNLKAGASKADALRNAALQLSKNPKYYHPFYWAPFVLVGEGF